jgi:hypothetical protein
MNYLFPIDNKLARQREDRAFSEAVSALSTDELSNETWGLSLLFDAYMNALARAQPTMAYQWERQGQDWYRVYSLGDVEHRVYDNHMSDVAYVSSRGLFYFRDYIMQSYEVSIDQHILDDNNLNGTKLMNQVIANYPKMTGLPFYRGSKRRHDKAFEKARQQKGVTNKNNRGMGKVHAFIKDSIEALSREVLVDALMSNVSAEDWEYHRIEFKPQRDDSQVDATFRGEAIELKSRRSTNRWAYLDEFPYNDVRLESEKRMRNKAKADRLDAVFVVSEVGGVIVTSMAFWGSHGSTRRGTRHFDKRAFVDLQDLLDILARPENYWMTCSDGIIEAVWHRWGEEPNDGNPWYEAFLKRWDDNKQNEDDW